MAGSFGFEQLDVWNKSIVFADRVYDLIGSFPSDERFGLTNQMRRASVSVSSNIAEGSGRGSNKEFSRFVGIACASVCEVVSQSHIARRREFIGEPEFQELREKADELARMLSGLRGSLDRRS